MTDPNDSSQQSGTPTPGSEARKLKNPWVKLVLFVPAIVLPWALMSVAMGATPRWTTMAVGALPLLYFLSAGLYLHQQRLRSGDRGPRLQFGMPFLLATVTAAALWLALARWDYMSMLERHRRREQVEAEIRQIVGAGEVHLSAQLVIQVKRAAFNDDDLRRVLAMQRAWEEIDADLQLLDLSNTAVTDAGVQQLADCDRLEYLFLSGTAVTDTGFKTAARLPSLKMISMNSTRVTPEALSQMRAERPQLQITALPDGK